MSFVKRTRIVSVRVSQDEYQILDEVSRRQGANSVSEFLRQLIMNSAPFSTSAISRDREVVEELAALRRKVDQLSQLVKEQSGKPDSEEITTDEAQSQRGALWQEAVADA